MNYFTIRRFLSPKADYLIKLAGYTKYCNPIGTRGVQPTQVLNLLEYWFNTNSTMWVVFTQFYQLKFQIHQVFI